MRNEWLLFLSARLEAMGWHISLLVFAWSNSNNSFTICMESFVVALIVLNHDPNFFFGYLFVHFWALILQKEGGILCFCWTGTSKSHDLVRSNYSLDRPPQLGLKYIVISNFIFDEILCCRFWNCLISFGDVYFFMEDGGNCLCGVLKLMLVFLDSFNRLKCSIAKSKH